MYFVCLLCINHVKVFVSHLNFADEALYLENIHTDLFIRSVNRTILQEGSGFCPCPFCVVFLWGFNSTVKDMHISVTETLNGCCWGCEGLCVLWWTGDLSGVYSCHMSDCSLGWTPAPAVIPAQMWPAVKKMDTRWIWDGCYNDHIYSYFNDTLIQPP